MHCCLILKIFYIFIFLALSQEENAMGRFLKHNGKTDKTRAGKMMTSVGKAQSYASQQRLNFYFSIFKFIFLKYLLK